MTTQQSYPEHNDVDTAVVAEAHASETSTDAPPSSVSPPAREETPEQPASADVQLAGEQIPQALPETKVQEEAAPSAEQADSDHAPANADATDAGEVKEFTTYIEEFRQAEARFSRAIQEAEAREAQQGTTTAATPPSTTPISSVEEVFVPEFTVAWETPDIAATPTLEPTEETKETTLTTEPAITVEPETSVTKETSVTNVTNVTNQTSVTPETAEAPTPPARPVSPLLRPATRIRMPRHSARHREEARAASTEAVPQGEAQTTQPVQNEATPVETPAQPAESTQEVEQPRPARRYRFDNRSKTAPAIASVSTPTPTPPTTPATPTTQTSAEVGLTNGHNGQSVQAVEREVQQPTKAVQQTQPEEQSAKLNAAESGLVEHEAAQPQSHTEPERRRKHGQERQRGKEQQATPQQQQAQSAATTAAEIAISLNAQQVIPAVVEPVAEQKDSVESEDLPPLEYADLQKANTRRRRRRHVNGASVAALTGNTFPAAPDSPTTTPTPPTTQPRPIATPPAAQQRPVVAPSTTLPQRPAATPPSVVTTNQAPFSITSGYTVNQMNQGSDNTGPFMGPEPSPARGTLAAQNVRSIRTDAQRTPAYPVRSTEATSASVNQLANIVAQAIQTQTDRMVAELRRANQAPTNISVSMPPFPSNERVGVFVDVANLLYSARTLRMAVDFGKLLDFLRGNRRLIRAHAYCPTSPQPGDEQMFLQAVKGLGYRITTKNYKTFSSGAKKADLDLDLCMDVVRLVDGRAVDCIVLVSGDSDFMPMLDYCSDHGVRVEVAAFDEAMSATLRQSCDLFINLSMLEEIRA